MKLRIPQCSLFVLATFGFVGFGAGCGGEDIINTPQPDLQVEPSREVTFNPVSPFQTDTQFVTITNVGEGELEILTVQVEGPGNVFEVSEPDVLFLAPSDSTTVSVSYTPESPDRV